MQENPRPSLANEKIDVVLEGGPSDIPSSLRVEPSALIERKVKVPHLGGYEHFELVGDSMDLSRLIFQWTMRTKIAE